MVGRGFHRVAQRRPRHSPFRGHYQPRIPRDLGFYDLTDASTMGRQIQLAQAAGLHGFSFHYYWFNGRRLLDQPLDRFVADQSHDFGFCLTWANENWTRRWDGYDKEILIAQDYSDARDHELVDDVQRYFNDRRYIRITDARSGSSIAPTSFPIFHERSSAGATDGQSGMARTR